MGQIFTVNINQSSYEFQLLKLKQENRQVESQILFKGSELTLFKNAGKSWEQKDASNQIMNDLIRGIGNTISLRYRV